MEHAIENKENIRVCAPHHLLEHIFLFQTLNGAGVPSKYINYFKRLPPADGLRLLDYMNDKYYLSARSFDGLALFNEASRKKICQVLNAHRENKGFNNIKNTFKYWSDIIKSIGNKRGFTITFSGVDGAGKSTILAAIKGVLEEKYRKNVVVLSSPSFLVAYFKLL